MPPPEPQARRVVEVLPIEKWAAVSGVAHAPVLVEPVVLAALERFLEGGAERGEVGLSPFPL